jgi:ABC-2 type transport system permease protein
MRESLASRLSVGRWIAVNELHRLIADRTIIFFGLAMPVAIILLVGSTFGGAATIPIGVLDADRSPASAALVDAFGDADQVEVHEYRSMRNLRRDVRTGGLYLAVVVPAGYARDVDQGDASLPLIVDPTSDEVGSALAVVRGVVDGVAVEEAAVGFVAERAGGDGDEAEAAVAVAAAAGSIEPVGAVDIDDEDQRGPAGAFAYPAPANLVLFVFINTFVVSSVLATDRKAGIVRRLLATPHRTGTVLGGIGAARFAFALLQSTIILVVGRLVFDVHWGDPIGALSLVVLFAMLATSVGLLVGSLVSSSEQAQAIGIPIGVAMGMLGGCMWPLDIVPDAMRIAGHIVPHAWAMDAWEDLAWGEDVTVVDILPELGVLAGFTVVLGVLAARALRATTIR